MRSNKLQFFILLFLISTLAFCAYQYHSTRKKEILIDIYHAKSVELKDEIKNLIKEKQGGTASLTFVLSNDSSVKNALLKEDKSFINFDEILLGLHNLSDYKHIWIQIVDKDGNNFYRSWMDKSGDYMAKARKDIAMMIQDPKPMDHISTGKFDMTFKTMRPLFHEGEFIGMIEMITHFNSIAKKLVLKILPR